MDLTQIVFISIIILGLLFLFIIAYPLYYSLKKRLNTEVVMKKSLIPSVSPEPVVNHGFQFVNSEAVHLPQQQVNDFNPAGETQERSYLQLEKPTSVRKAHRFEVYSNIPNPPRQGAYMNNYKNWSSNWN